MGGGEIEQWASLPEVVSIGQMSDELGRVVQQGGNALRGSNVWHEQFAAIHESGEVALFDLSAPYFGTDVSVERGLTITGVMRKTGILRRSFVEYEPGDIQRGDRAVLIDAEGLSIKTLKLRPLDLSL